MRKHFGTTIHLSILRCLKCGKPVNAKDNPEMTYELQKEMREKHGQWSGWLCKCGEFNGLDP